MKKIVSKSAMPPTLVLMAGLPGVGKSTLASRLGLDLGYEWVVIDKDTLKDSFLEDARLKEQVAEDTAGWAAYEAFFKMAREFLVNQHRSVILDTSTLHRFVFDRARDLARDVGAELKVILCEVDERTRQHRLRTRRQRVSQAQSHLVSLEAAKQFDELLPDHTLRISTKDPLKKYEEKALAYISGTKLMVSSPASAETDVSYESPISRLAKIF